MSDYDTDILTWSERQADLLRRIAAGEQINNQADWPNIIEEVEAWPLSEAVPHWQAEARGFRAQARRKYRPSMSQKIDVPGLYADALYAMPETIDGQPPLPVETVCRVTLDELLFGD